MAVANPCLQKEWGEWKREMEVNRRMTLWERVRRWTKVEVNEEEEEDDVEETNSGEEEESEEGENEGWKGEKVVEIEEGSEQEGEEEEEEEEKVNREVNEENEVSGAWNTEEEEENKEVDSEEEREVTGEEKEEVNEEREAEEKMVKWEEVKATEVEELKEGEEVEEYKVREDRADDEEEEVKEAERLEEEKKKLENEFHGEAEENEEVEDEERKVVTQDETLVSEVREEARENDREETEATLNEQEDEDEDEDKASGKDEQPEQEQIEHDDLGVHVRENMNDRIELVCPQQNPESAEQDHVPIKEEDNSSDLVESVVEDSDGMESEDETFKSERVKDEDRAIEKQSKNPCEVEDCDETSTSDENRTQGAWTSGETGEEEEESEKPTNDKDTVSESWTTQVAELEDYQEKLQEEEEEEDSTDEEDAEYSMYEDTDSNEDVEKTYCRDGYPMDIFRTLKEFRDSCLLTDLTLRTEDGKSFHVHSPVMAAVSSLIWESLSRNNDRADERKDDGTIAGTGMWSLSLGSEVNNVGVEAVVEFAYTGIISCLNKDTVEQIKTSALALGAPRVMDLCPEEESTKTRGLKEGGRISAAEQMLISLQSIKQLWTDSVGCDVILEGIGGLLHVHRVILAASSDYFRGMFTLGMRESHQPHVTLPFLLASELGLLISCSYSGALPLSWKCVFEITSIALQLQYQPALSLCLSFLQHEINPHSCLDVASFAEAYEMVQLLEVADDFVLRQFQKVACTLKFKDLPARHLLKYLNSHSLCVPSELVVFKAVVAWIQAKPKRRLRLTKELMKTIHFPLMTFKEFKEVQSLNMWSDHRLGELYNAIFEDFCSNNTAPQSQCRIYLPKESLVLIGGDHISEDLGNRSISKDLWFGNSLRNHTGIKKAMEWRKLGEMPGSARFCHEVAVLKGQLYVFGGKKYYGVHDTLSSVYRYDPHQNSWESLAEMQQQRSSFSVVVLNGVIYAFGGHCEPEYIDTVERYCPSTNSWSFTLPLDLPLRGHVAKVSQGQIFVSGGMNSDSSCLASMFLYHPETGSTYLANMSKPRAHHCMENLGDRLYVAGGLTTDENNTFVDQLDCEVYSPAADAWTAFVSINVPHVGAGSAVLEGKFYILGGYSQEDYSETTMVHRYDPTTQRWENMGKMPGPNNDIRAALLCLPSHFRL